MSSEVRKTESSPRIAYVQEGSSGPRVLLVMGFGMKGEVWRPQIEALSQSHQVAAFDNLGIGGSEPPTTPPRITTMAADALRVVDALGWSDFHVVGVSMGGMISQELALAAPQRVRSLTLIVTQPGGVTAVLPRRAGVIPFLGAQSPNPTKRVASLQKLLYTPEFLATVDRELLEQRMRDMVGTRAPRSTVLGQLGAVLRHDTRSRLGQIKPPTLVVKASRDLLVQPRHSDTLAAQIPNARLEVFEDAGHGITFQAAARLNGLIAEHVARHA